MIDKLDGPTADRRQNRSQRPDPKGVSVRVGCSWTDQAAHRLEQNPYTSRRVEAIDLDVLHHGRGPVSRSCVAGAWF